MNNVNMPKPKTTRTYGPIHFEDLEPHRFEDLIRQLIYDYKDWQKLEATGRSGSDEGFDIRAYEKDLVNSELENEDDNLSERVNVVEGNLWMIQAKREKQISPTKLKNIISEIDENNPPHGYILVGSVNFSKKSYDIFREELRKKGIAEFYLWGRGELEDMLYLPKNDRILFTFFGISLTSRRKSLSTKIRSAITIKNKIYRTIADKEEGVFSSPVLIREINDRNYPYKTKYKDFDRFPRWNDYLAFQHHPLGLLCHTREYFAYIDSEKKEWDFTDSINLAHKNDDHFNNRNDRFEQKELIKNFYDFLPNGKKGYFVSDGLVKYEDIIIFDDKGDSFYKFPHIYVDSSIYKSFFTGFRDFLKLGKEEIDEIKKYKRVKIFPKKFEKVKNGKIYKDKKSLFDEKMIQIIKDYDNKCFYSSNKKFEFLKPRDIILVSDKNNDSGSIFIQITYKCQTKLKDYIEKEGDRFYKIMNNLKIQLEKDFDKKDKNIYIYEFKRTYEAEFNEK